MCYMYLTYSLLWKQKEIQKEEIRQPPTASACVKPMMKFLSMQGTFSVSQGPEQCRGQSGSDRAGPACCPCWGKVTKQKLCRSEKKFIVQFKPKSWAGLKVLRATMSRIINNYKIQSTATTTTTTRTTSGTSPGTSAGADRGDNKHLPCYLPLCLSVAPLSDCISPWEMVLPVG